MSTERKKAKNCGLLTEPSYPAGGLGGAVSPPKFFDIFNSTKEFWGIW